MNQDMIKTARKNVTDLMTLVSGYNSIEGVDALVCLSHFINETEKWVVKRQDDSRYQGIVKETYEKG